MTTTLSDTAGLVSELRHADQHSQQRVWGSRIFGEAADALDAMARELAEAREESLRKDGYSDFDVEAAS